MQWQDMDYAMLKKATEEIVAMLKCMNVKAGEWHTMHQSKKNQLVRYVTDPNTNPWARSGYRIDIIHRIEECDFPCYESIYDSRSAVSLHYQVRAEYNKFCRATKEKARACDADGSKATFRKKGKRE